MTNITHCPYTGIKKMRYLFMAEHMPEQLKVFRIAGIFVADGQTVDAPALAACPGGFGTVALVGNTVARFACFRIEEIGMISRIIRPDHDA